MPAREHTPTGWPLGTVPVSVECQTHPLPRCVGTTHQALDPQSDAALTDGWTIERAAAFARQCGISHAHAQHGPEQAEITWGSYAPDGTVTLHRFHPPTITREQQTRALASSGIYPATVTTGWRGPFGAWPRLPEEHR